jgi:peptidoglycan biosynthesis protein MviN/MurJ (putative lipid II flippase)
MKMKIPRTSKRISLGSAAILLVGSSLLAQVLGFWRTKLVNANFAPAGIHSTDSYFAAFNIPDFFFFTISAGALGVAFIPVLTDHFEHHYDGSCSGDICVCRTTYPSHCGAKAGAHAVA